MLHIVEPWYHWFVLPCNAQITYIYTSMYVKQLHGKGWVDGHGVSATCKDIGDSMILLKQFKNTVFISWDEMEVVS